MEIKDNMENTLENKLKFIVQYYGQKVANIQHPFEEDYIGKVEGLFIEEINYLELKSISSITDEDLYFIGFLFGWEKLYGVNHPNVLYQAKEIISRLFTHPNSHCELSLYLNLYDYLRSKGYALPWMGLSVEKLQEYGWIKLIH